jgi:hypothetical protein
MHLLRNRFIAHQFDCDYTVSLDRCERDMFTHTAQPTGLRRERLYRAFLSAKDHAGMTADGVQLVTDRRRVVGSVEPATKVMIAGLRGLRRQRANILPAHGEALEA